MAEVNKHFVVAGFTKSDGDTAAAVGSVHPTLYPSLLAANDKAKELASLDPGHYYVSYEAQFFAFTDITPVSLQRVGAVGS